MRLLKNKKRACPPKFFLGKVRRVHMIGIKGAGMSALAVNLKSMGIKVGGSDHAESFFTDALLKKHGFKVSAPFSPNNIPADTDLVIASTAYNNKNVAVQEAYRKKLKILTYPEVLGLLTRQLHSIAVCGSHGKTTTSGILAYLLSKTAYRPIINVGSIVPQLINYRACQPKLFVFEADEYQNKFKYFHPQIVILTNIDYDHPDYFRSPSHYKSVFREFIKRTPRSGLLVYCADDKNVLGIVNHAKCKKIGYGFSKYADRNLKIDQIAPAQMKFLVSGLGGFDSKLIGKHNALNLAAAAICANYLKIPAGQIKKAIASFIGTKRRLEIMKKVKISGHECIIMDDFGHHPTEIEATIETIKKAYPGKTLWTAFQPHTFSRTKALFNDFAKCFTKSDKTIILDIYTSKREVGGKIHSRDLVKKINSPDVVYKPDIATAADFLKKKIKTDSIILTIGASEVWRLAKLF